MATRRPAVPGAATGADDVAVQQPAEVPRDIRAERMGLPDFRQLSCEAARAWFEQNPTAPKRNVLTAEGWYVHPETPGSRALAGR